MSNFFFEIFWNFFEYFFGQPKLKYENGEAETYDESQNNNLHKYLCRGKDVMTIYSLLAIYTWVLIEGKKTVVFRLLDSFCV